LATGKLVFVRRAVLSYHDFGPRVTLERSGNGVIMSVRIPRLALFPFLAAVLVLVLGLPGVSGAQVPAEDEDSITPPPVAEPGGDVGEPEGKGDIAPPDDDGPDSAPGGPDGPGPVPPGGVGVPPVNPDAWVYQPRYGFQMSAFFATHPTDTYMGVLLAGHMHLGPRLSISGDLRLGGGHDNDGDQYVSSLISLGGSAYWWFRGHQPFRAFQPYARLGVGYLWMPDERFDDGTDDDDDEWKTSRNFKKDGQPAPGHSDTTFSEAVGLRVVLLPTSGYTEIGASFDVELALYQDMHYGFGDTGLMITFGLSMFY
jgi:hypothetical protein